MNISTHTQGAASQPQTRGQTGMASGEVQPYGAHVPHTASTRTEAELFVYDGATGGTGGWLWPS